MRKKSVICLSIFVILNFSFWNPVFADENDDKIEEGEQELVYESPAIDQKKFYFADHFDDIEKSEKKWIKSQARKDDTAEEIAKYDGVWNFESPERIVWKNDIGLVLKSKAKHAAIAAKLNKKFEFTDKPLVVQYEVTMQNGQDCGGSYIKLLSDSKSTNDLTQFNDKTPYSIMFGPDKCGNDIKLHFIFRHTNPINNTISEKHCRKPKERLEKPFTDKLPHLYQLVVNPDNTFQIRVDRKLVNEGSLLSDFTPPVNPPKEIDDPNDKKPENWDEREKIPDPDAKKPDDWDENAPSKIPDPSAVKPNGWLDDEPEMIPDPAAVTPEDWDQEIDGDWEAPLIDNPMCEKSPGCGEWKPPMIENADYKGKWFAPLIDNPNYQGKWTARKIPNPDFFEDLNPFHMAPIAAVGIEIWSMSDNILFDNLIITDDVDLADEFAEKTYEHKIQYINKESETFLNKAIKYTNENPWMWGVYLVLIGAPVVFLMYTLCCPANKDKAEKDPKKTDEPTADDKVNEEESKQKTKSKSDLDVKVTDDNSEVEDDVEIVDNEENDVEEVGDQEQDAEVEEPKTEEVQAGTRKRKPRKE